MKRLPCRKAEICSPMLHQSFVDVVTSFMKTLAPGTALIHTKYVPVFTSFRRVELQFAGTEEYNVSDFRKSKDVIVSETNVVLKY
jgi:hypothetical protein